MEASNEAHCRRHNVNANIIVRNYFLKADYINFKVPYFKELFLAYLLLITKVGK